VPNVLIVDDEKNIRATLSVCLESAGDKVAAVATPAAALDALGREHFDIAFVDLRLGDASGLDLIPRLLEVSPGLAIVVMTAYATYDTAVEAVRRGASDYVPKPFTPAQIRHAVERLEERRVLAQRVQELEQTLAGVAPEIDLASGSSRMRTVGLRRGGAVARRKRYRQGRRRALRARAQRAPRATLRDRELPDPLGGAARQ
jgi:NtrC-family two-component system response regulator AlgB